MERLFSRKEDKRLIELIKVHPCIYDIQHALYKDTTIKEVAWSEVGRLLEKPPKACKKRWKNIRDTYVRRMRKIQNGERPKYSTCYKWELSFLRFSPHEESDTSIRIQSVESYGDTRDVTCVGGSMDSDEPIAPPIVQFEAEDNSNISTPSTSSQNVYSTEPSTFHTEQADENSSSQRGYEGSKDELSQKVSAILKKRSEQREDTLKKMSPQKEEDSLDIFFRSVIMSVRNLRPCLVNEAKIRILQLLAELEEKQANEGK